MPCSHWNWLFYSRFEKDLKNFSELRFLRALDEHAVHTDIFGHSLNEPVKSFNNSRPLYENSGIKASFYGTHADALSDLRDNLYSLTIWRFLRAQPGSRVEGWSLKESKVIIWVNDAGPLVPAFGAAKQIEPIIPKDSNCLILRHIIFTVFTSVHNYRQLLFVTVLLSVKSARKMPKIVKNGLSTLSRHRRNMQRMVCFKKRIGDFPHRQHIN